MPLISPGIAITAPPFLPRDSLVLLTRHADRRIAERIVGEVPEVKGVIADKGIVPGIPGDSLSGGDANVLLAGCDVRADIFRSSNGSFAVYKQQSLLHIEFPRGADPKIRSVESMIRKRESGVFIDACSGAGTLGITALLAGVPEVVLNDAWYPASFWSAINLHANRNLLDMDRVEVPPGYDPERWREVPCNPVETGIARGEGKRAVVLWGDFREMGDRIPEGRILAAIDIFGKSDPSKTGKIIREWEAAYGGDAFIP